MADGTVTFDKLSVAAWRQFANVDIKFHPQLTVITGANGAGKSTLLNIIGRHLGVDRGLLSLPKFDERGLLSYLPGLSSISDWFHRFRKSSPEKEDPIVGEVAYSSGAPATLRVPSHVGVSYSLIVQNQRQVPGIHIGSHRGLPNYQGISQVSLSGANPRDVYGALINGSNSQFNNSQHPNTIMFEIKSALLNWKIFGEGSNTIVRNLDQADAFDGLVEVLRKVLPPEIEFLRVEVRPPEVVLVTRSGEFLIDAGSGGIIKLIELAALIYARSMMDDVLDGKFVVTIDEPENHLHPSLQRTVLAQLIKTFPAVQFIVATHSPFIVSAVRDARVYVLRHQGSDPETSTSQSMSRVRIVSEFLDYKNRAGSASEILQDVLGIPSILPQWVDDELQKIVAAHQRRGASSESLAELKAALSGAGLQELLPEALVKLSGKQ